MNRNNVTDTDASEETSNDSSTEVLSSSIQKQAFLVFAEQYYLHQHPELRTIFKLYGEEYQAILSGDVEDGEERKADDVSPALRAFISYAWPILDCFPHEWWHQLFLVGLRHDLRELFGIEAYVDVIDSIDNPVRYMIENFSQESFDDQESSRHQSSLKDQKTHLICMMGSESFVEKCTNDRFISSMVRYEKQYIQDRISCFTDSGLPLSQLPFMAFSLGDFRTCVLPNMAGHINAYEAQRHSYYQLLEAVLKKVVACIIPSDNQLTASETLFSNMREDTRLMEVFNRKNSLINQYYLSEELIENVQALRNTYSLPQWLEGELEYAVSQWRDVIVREQEASREIRSSSINFFSDPPPPLQFRSDKNQECFHQIKQKLKNSYLSEANIRLFDDDRQIAMEDLFVNLVIVKEKEQREKDKEAKELKLENTQGLMQHYEDLHAPKEDIAIENIFKGSNDPSEQKALKKIELLGRAGFGKTTLCKYLAYRWAHANPQYALWQKKYAWVFYFPLKILVQHYKADETYGLADILYTEVLKPLNFPESLKYVFYDEVMKDPSRVLFVLDGYDEVAFENHPIIEEVLLKQAPQFLVTSRPYARISEKTDATLENIGFTDQNIQEYIHRFYAHAVMRESVGSDEIEETKASELHESDPEASVSEEAKALVSWLDTHPSIKTLSHIPINCELLCQLWQDEEHGLFSDDVFTMSDLYQAMLNKLLIRYLRKLPEFENALDYMDEDDLLDTPKAQDVKLFLMLLAFEGLKQNRLIIDPGLVKRVRKLRPELNADPKVLVHLHQSGLLKSTRPGSPLAKQSFYFMHYSFQEYLAAGGYLATTTDATLDIEFIRTQKYNPMYQLMLIYVAGMLKDQSERLNLFFEALLEAPRDLRGEYELALLLRCSEEARWPECLNVKSSVLDVAKRCLELWVNDVLNKNFNRGLIYGHKIIFLDALNVCPLANQAVISDSNVFCQIKNALSDESSEVRSRAVKVLSQLSLTIHNTTRALSCFESLLSDKRSDVCNSALSALSELSLTAEHASLVLPWVERLLGDENDWVRDSAVWLLEALSLTDEHMSHLLLSIEGLLGDARSEIRATAFSALSVLSLTAEHTSDVLSWVEVGLEDACSEVRANGFSALITLSLSIKQTANVITWIDRLLVDQSPIVRDSAALSLGVLSFNAEFVTHLLSSIERLLGDKRFEARASGVKALGALSLTVERTSEVLVSIGRLLENERAEVRISTVRALRMLPLFSEQTSAVLPWIKRLLRDEESYVRESAVRILSRLSLTVEQTSELFAVVDRLLGDERPMVRASAMSALGMLSLTVEQIATVLPSIERLFEDKQFMVRERLLKVLGVLPLTIEHTDHVLASINNFLKNKKCWVRGVAVSALGVLPLTAEQTSEVLPWIKRSLEDEHFAVRASTVRVLVALSLNAEHTSHVLPWFESLLESDVSLVRDRAVLALETLSLTVDQTSDVLIWIERLLEDEECETYASAVKALGVLSLSSEHISKVLPLIERLFRNQQDWVRNTALKILGVLSQTKEWIFELLPWIESSLRDQSICDGAVRILIYPNIFPVFIAQYTWGESQVASIRQVLAAYYSEHPEVAIWREDNDICWYENKTLMRVTCQHPDDLMHHILSLRLIEVSDLPAPMSLGFSFASDGDPLELGCESEEKVSEIPEEEFLEEASIDVSGLKDRIIEYMRSIDMLLSDISSQSSIVRFFHGDRRKDKLEALEKLKALLFSPSTINLAAIEEIEADYPNMYLAMNNSRVKEFFVEIKGFVREHRLHLRHCAPILESELESSQSSLVTMNA
ncbi:MAG: HEAT repeat domain-containing protein [Gammaproteobacteria bacterium]